LALCVDNLRIIIPTERQGTAVYEFLRTFFLRSQLLPFSGSRPIVHLCGHIHESHGILEEEGGTTTVNAAALDHDGKLTWQPVVLDIAADGSVKSVSIQD